MVRDVLTIGIGLLVIWAAVRSSKETLVLD
jgi:hypothetical protein